MNNKYNHSLPHRQEEVLPVHFVSGSTFDVLTAGVGGPYAITYTYTDANGCTSDTTMFIDVDANEASAFGSAEMIIGFGTPIYGITGGDYNWSPAESVACSTGDSTIATRSSQDLSFLPHTTTTDA